VKGKITEHHAVMENSLKNGKHYVGHWIFDYYVFSLQIPKLNHVAAEGINLEYAKVSLVTQSKGTQMYISQITPFPNEENYQIKQYLEMGIESTIYIFGHGTHFIRIIDTCFDEHVNPEIPFWIKLAVVVPQLSTEIIRNVDKKCEFTLFVGEPFSFFLFSCGDATTLTLQQHQESNLQIFVDTQVGFPNTSRHTYAITDDKKEKSLLLPQGGEFFVSIFDNKHYLRNSPTTFTILIDDPTGKAYHDLKISKRKKKKYTNHFPVPSQDSSSDDNNKLSPKKRLSHEEKLSEIKSIGEKLTEDQPRLMLYLPTVLLDHDSDSKKTPISAAGELHNLREIKYLVR